MKAEEQRKDALRRHPSLKPLARDHGIGLVCVQGLHKAIRASEHDRMRMAEQIQTICQDIILSYIKDEERILSSYVPAELIDEFSHRHNNVRQMVDRLTQLEPADDPGLGLLSRIADAVDDYVRWEERTLFPAIEGTLPGDQLKQLHEETTFVENGRSRLTQQLHASVSMSSPGWLAEGGSAR